MRESLRIDQYLEFPRACEWVAARGGHMTYGQVDPGPAMGYLWESDPGVIEIHVGQSIHWDGKKFAVA